jgi:hypothetical protein
LLPRDGLLRDKLVPGVDGQANDSARCGRKKPRLVFVQVIVNGIPDVVPPPYPAVGPASN